MSAVGRCWVDAKTMCLPSGVGVGSKSAPANEAVIWRTFRVARVTYSSGANSVGSSAPIALA